LTIIGTGFDSDTVVNGFDYPLTPTSVTPAVPPSNVTKLVVTVPQSALATAATPSVTVSNSNGLSNAMVFNITQQGFVSTPFDDGYQSTYDYGFPIFDKVGMSYTWYIITYKPLLDNSYFATWPEILTVAGRPNAEIGNHTRTHAGVQPCPTCPIQFLTLLSDTPTTLSACSPASDSTNGCTPDYSFPIVTTLPDEIIGAQQDLEFMGLKPLTLAYPYGDYDMAPGEAWPPLPFSEQKVEMAVQAAGLVGARTTDFCANVGGLPMGQPPECGYGTTGWNPYAIQAFEVNQNSIPTTLAEIQYWTQPALPGHYDPTRQWTIITFHQVQDAAAGYTDTDVDTVDVTLLQSIVDYFIAQNIPVVTMSEGMVILNLNGQISVGTGPSSSVRSTFPRR
jgi:peptidoglycan/xylan/chitin deacetylase (PgdA/CDA1 family)